MDYKLGFIGYGEAAFHISSGLTGAGLDSVAAYDVKQTDDSAGARIRERAAQAGVTLADSLDSLIVSAKFVASLTSASVAFAIAQSVIPRLEPGQVYVDMNSAGPTVKAKIAEIDRAPGVLVCDAAVMSTVPGNGHKVPMLLAGDGSADFCAAFIRYGMDLTDLHSAAGGASAIKMFRSVFMKGLPQLMIEAMVPACKYGALGALTDSLNGSLVGKTMEQLADTFVARTILHAARRAHEMDDAIQTLEEMGLDASMSKGTKQKLEELAASGLSAKIAGNEKMPYRDALALLVGN